MKQKMIGRLIMLAIFISAHKAEPYLVRIRKGESASPYLTAISSISFSYVTTGALLLFVFFFSISPI